MMSTYSLFQTVNDTTHFHHNGTTSTIDLLLASHSELVQDCTTIPALSNSDHSGLLATLSLKTTFSTLKTCIVWRYNYADWDTACNLIEATDWSATLDPGDINNTWANWRDKFLSIMDKCIPKATLPPRRNRPWLTKKLIQAISRRNAIHKHAKSTKDYSKYRYYRNKVTKDLRCAKDAYFHNLDSKQPKKF